MMEYIFLKTFSNMRGGQSTDILAFDKEGLFDDIEEWQEGRMLSTPKYRLSWINQRDCKLFKHLTLPEFEDVFGDDYHRLGKLLEYNRSKYGEKYPVFLKKIYEKYGIDKQKGELN